MVKLAVGVSSIADMAELHARQPGDAIIVRTRMFPKQAEALLAGGSLFRVIAGSIQCRQRILRIDTGERDDGVACAIIALDRAIVPVLPRAMRPFQGWRYLKAADAPPDLSAMASSTGDLPPDLRRALGALCLL
ncbi:DUF1489 domain-containing protein [Ameyamaea chiangmaiensis]|uniref:DUF1489 domain-containing protein n=1 Tax=Ameyamaea chiangmaiensis TaxID=442969 RepID=A0A850PCE3_9PROT|nr:DUF1489 domain-containing protein [Ameyamaea chiangmaiensis]MBS4075941.1 DUF1489 domain-containing protein [Ameyamaea chiangmaiensis]NVN40190.1 DUF1489 domain-containing protein [Ameyamaea chiangmaiensis]